MVSISFTVLMELWNLKKEIITKQDVSATVMVKLGLLWLLAIDVLRCVRFYSKDLFCLKKDLMEIQVFTFRNQKNLSFKTQIFKRVRSSLECYVFIIFWNVFWSIFSSRSSIWILFCKVNFDCSSPNFYTVHFSFSFCSIICIRKFYKSKSFTPWRFCSLIKIYSCKYNFSKFREFSFEVISPHFPVQSTHEQLCLADYHFFCHLTERIIN